MPPTASPSSAQEYVFKLGSIHDGTGFALADSAQMAATGRKTWKALKGKSEAVWPAFIEASLIEALERYRPEESAGTMLVGRFPRRNRFISDYIFKATGKRRTPKQVGSRLQQLRETSRDPHIIELLQKRDFTAELDVQYPEDSNRQSPSISSPSPASTSISDTDEASVAHLSSPVNLGIDLTATTSTFDTPQGRIGINFLLGSPWMVVETSTEAFSLVLFDIVSSPSDGLAQPLRPASSKLVSKENPQFIFESSSHLKLNEHLYCVFHVFLGDTIIHTETTPVTALPHQAVQGSLYAACLLPEYWTTICTAQSKASRYTILQEVRRTPADTRVADAALFSVHYDFCCSTTITCPPSQDIPYSPDVPSDYPHHSQFHSPITPDYQTSHPAAPLYTWPRDVGLLRPNSPSQLNYEPQPYNHEYQSPDLYLPPAGLEFDYDYSKIPLGWSVYDGGYPLQWPDYYYGA
ncbi:TEC1 family protein [Pleurotus pulmonarius]